MKLTILGSTCAIGKVITAKALEQKHTVNVLVRDPDKLGDLKDKLNVIQGDYFDSAKLSQAIKGADAVLSTIGPPIKRTPNSTSEHYLTAMKSLIKAMEDQGTDRIIVILGAGIMLPNEKLQISRRVIRFMTFVAAKYILVTKQGELELLMASKLNWTALRPPMIKEVKGKLIVDDSKMASLSVDIYQLADFMLDSINNSDWYQKSPVLSTA